MKTNIINRILSSVVAGTLILSCAGTAISAAGNDNLMPMPITKGVGNVLDDNVDLTEMNYISFSDYLKKYGEQSVVNGFNKAENEIYGNAAPNVEVANLQNSNGKSLFDCLSEGKFLGMEIISVSDLPPDSHDFSIQVKDERNASQAEGLKNNEMLPMSTNSNKKETYTNYDVYYSDNKPGTSDLNQAYEPKSGSYVYKFSYAFDDNYLSSTDLVFNNTTLGCGSQKNNMYAYIAAKSGTRTFDFGLMANPSDSYRNQGLYAFHSNDRGTLDVEPYPKVYATYYNTSTKRMTLENKTVTLRLSIGTGTAEMYMESNGQRLFYKVKEEKELVSGTSAPLTFMEGMSSVVPNETVNLKCGSYFRNVKFSNSKLYSYTKGTRDFPTYGAATYYVFACKPSALNFSYGANIETISIDYN